MADMPTWAQALASSSIVAALVGFFVKREVKRYDEQGERLDDLDERKANKSDLKELVAEIRDERKETKLTLAALDDKLDITISNWNKIEGKVGQIERELEVRNRLGR